MSAPTRPVITSEQHAELAKRHRARGHWNRRPISGPPDPIEQLLNDEVAQFHDARALVHEAYARRGVKS